MKKSIRIISAFLVATMVNAVPPVMAEELENRIEIFVSLDGNDRNSGSIESPLATLEAARDKIRDMKNSGTYPETGGVTVYLREGDYRLKNAFSLSEEDSGTASSRITYKAYNNENVRFVGAEHIDGNSFRVVTDAKILSKLPVKARGKVYQCDLRANGIDSVGQIQTTGHGSWYEIPYSTLIVDEKPQTIAQYPNVEEGTAAWMKVDKQISAENGSSGLKFQYKDDRAVRWTEAEDAWILGLWMYAFAPGVSKIEKIDTEKKTIQLGVSNLDFSKSTSPNKPYYVFNLLEEMDVPGEYYFDRENMIAYLYPDTDNLAGADIIVPVDVNPQLSSTASYITFEDLKFGYTLGSVGTANGDYVEFYGCEFNHVGSQALTMNGKKSGVRDCNFYNLGAGGINISGPLVWNDNKPVTCDSYVINCDFNKFEQISLTYRPAVYLGSGCICTNNSFHDSPHEALSFSGHLNTVMYNEFYDLVKITEDAAAIYTGRNMVPRGNVVNYNYFHDILGLDEIGTRAVGVYMDDSWSGTEVKGNVFERVSRPMMFNGGQFNKAINNLIIDGTHATTQGISFHYNDIHDNPETREAQFNQGHARAIAYKAITDAVRQGPEGKYFPEILEANMDNFNNPIECEMKNNIAVNAVLCAQGLDNIYTKSGVTAVHAENNYQTSEDIFVDYENGDYRFKDIDKIREKVPGWEEIPFDKMGLMETEKRSELEKSGRLLDFLMYMPANGEQNVENESVKFAWGVAGNGYNKYRLTIAKDSEFKNIVKDIITSEFTKSIYDLEPDTQYFWKVSGVKTKGADAKEIESSSGVYSFITATDGVKNESNNVELVDITEFLKDKENWVTDPSQSVEPVFNADGQLEIKRTGKEFDRGVGLVAYNGRKLRTNELLHFSMFTDTDHLICLGIRAEGANANHYSNPQYVMYCKPERTELMCYNPGSIFTEVFDDGAKLEVGKGKWHDVVLGAYNTNDGVNIVMYIDGEKIIDYIDSNITKSGYVQFYYAGTKGDFKIGPPLMEVEAPVITDIPEDKHEILKSKGIFGIGMSSAYSNLSKIDVNDRDCFEVPVMFDGKTYISAQFFAKLHNAEYKLSEDGKTATVNSDKYEIIITENSDIVTINGQEEKLDTKAVRYRNSIAIPVRNLAEFTGKTVKWFDGGVIVIADNGSEQLESIDEKLVKQIAELLNPEFSTQSVDEISKYSYELGAY